MGAVGEVAGVADPGAPTPDRGGATAGGDDPWTEVLAAWGVAVGLAGLAWRFLPRDAAPFAACAVWWGVAVAAHLRAGRSLAAAGLTLRSVRQTLRVTLAHAAIVLPPYAAVFLALTGARGWEAPAFDVALFSFIGNLFFAALPEEVFFRGFVQPRLAAVEGPATRVEAPLIALGARAGVPLSPGAVRAALLFAITHVAFLPNPLSLQALERMTTFFPGLLFGALRQRTGDVCAAALFHAMCNAWLYSLQRGHLA